MPLFRVALKSLQAKRFAEVFFIVEHVSINSNAPKDGEPV